MKRLRQATRYRRLGAFGVLCLAYLLAAQGLMAVVGFGMSFASGQSAFVICRPFAHAQQPATGDPQRKPDPSPKCPFCFVASQSLGAAALAGGLPGEPAYDALPVAAVDSPAADNSAIPEYRRTGGEARAPPYFSV